MNKIFIIWLCILLCGCGNNISNKSSRFEIPTPERSADIELFEKVYDSTEIIDLTPIYSKPLPSVEDIIESVEIIPLETNEKSMLGKIRRYFTTDNKIYILDDYQLGGVAIFNMDGTFVKRIPHGNGPGELAYAFEMYYDILQKNLYVFDMMKHAILKYRDDGTYVATYYFNDSFDNFFVRDGYFMLATTERLEGYEVFQLQKIDTLLFRNLETISLGKVKARYTICDNIQQYSNGWNIVKDNVIYRYHNNRLYRRYIITNDINLGFMGLYAEGKDIQYMGIVYCKDGKASSAYRNKSNGLIWERKGSGSILFGSNRIKIYNVEQNVFSAILDPNYLCGEEDSREQWDGGNMNNLISDKDLSRLHKIKDDDNPVIVLYKIKAI